MSFELTGKVYQIFETKQISEKFSKRDFVIETDEGKYPQIVSFQIVNDKIEQIADLRIGDVVKVEFNVRGREWRSPSGEVKFFNTLDAWQVKRTSAQQPAPSGGGKSQPAQTQTTYGGAPADPDDIPF